MAPYLLPNAASNHQFQLITTALVSGLVVGASILGFQRLAKEERLSELKRSIPDLDDEKHPVQSLTPQGTFSPTDPDDIRTEALARRAQAGDYDDAVILEQLARNRAFLTPVGLDKLRAAAVVVVGCGGVGSHAAAALARSGVSDIRLVDFDQVSLSSLNRHAVATLADVGNPKVAVLARRLLAVTPWVRFDLRGEKFDAAAAGRLLGDFEEDGGRKKKKPDFVIDAIDNIDTKVELLRYCKVNGIPVISSMGAGTKSDPTRVTVGDIGTGTDDRLSRATRRKLKLLGITSGIPIVYSSEKSGEGKAELLPLSEEHFAKGKDAVKEFGVIQDFRVRILPVLGTMPAVFGYTVANHVILSITGYPHDYLPAKDRIKTYEGILNNVQASEEKLARLQHPDDKEVAIGLRVPVTTGDVAYLVEEIYRGRSAVSGVPTRVTLTRWEKPTRDIMARIGGVGGDGVSSADAQKASRLLLSELVCMTREEAARHHKEIFVEGKTVEELYDREILERVASRGKEAGEDERLK